MSGGPEDMRRADELLGKVELAAEALVDALLATGDPVFNKVNTAAVREANQALRRAGLRLVSEQVE